MIFSNTPLWARISAFFLFFWMFYIQSRSGMGTPLCYDDCLEYISASLQPHFQQYLSALIGPQAPRPFPIPFIFSLFSIFPRFSAASAIKIVQFQTFFSFFSWTLFAWTVTWVMKRGWKTSFVVFFGILSTQFANHLQEFNLYLLSDSLSFSFQSLIKFFQISTYFR